MEPTKLDALARTLSTKDHAPSRRGLLSGLIGGIAGLSGLALLEGAGAKKKKGGNKKTGTTKQKNAGTCGGNNGGNRPALYDGPVFTVRERTILDTSENPCTCAASTPWRSSMTTIRGGGLDFGYGDGPQHPCKIPEERAPLPDVSLAEICREIGCQPGTTPCG